MKDRQLLAIFAQQKPSADTLNNLSADTLNNLSAYTLNNLSAYTLNNLSADTLNNLSADTLNNLSADTLKNLKEYQDDIQKINRIEKPYSKIWEDIKAKKRTHDQSTFGPEECIDEGNVCGTAMCTAGHLVSMAGAYWAKQKYGWEKAASMVHQRSSSAHLPEQNYGSIPQEWALAFIEENASQENDHDNKN